MPNNIVSSKQAQLDVVIKHIVKYELFRHKRLFSRFTTAIREATGNDAPIRPRRTHADILAVLCRSYYLNEATTVSDVYLSSGLSKGTVISCVKKLKKEGVIIQKPAKEDKRRKNISFTTRFEHLLDEFAIECFHGLKQLANTNFPDSMSVENILKQPSGSTETMINPNFMISLSHDLRTTLNAISGYASMIEFSGSSENGSNNIESYAQHIQDASSELLGLINALTELSEFEVSGHIPVSFDEINIADTLDDSLEYVAHHAKKDGVSITVNSTDQLPVLVADKIRIKQVLIHILTNAIKYTPRNGAILIDLAGKLDSPFSINIRDNGPGLAERDRGIELAAFTRLASDNDKRDISNGIYLPLSRSIMELHGGSLNLSSPLEGGLVVEVIFPPEKTHYR